MHFLRSNVAGSRLSRFPDQRFRWLILSTKPRRKTGFYAPFQSKCGSSQVVLAAVNYRLAAQPLMLPPGVVLRAANKNPSLAGSKRTIIHSWLPEGQTEEECGQKLWTWYHKAGLERRKLPASLCLYHNSGYLPNSSSDPLRGPPSPRGKVCASRVNDHFSK